MNAKNSDAQEATIEERVAYLEGRLGVLPPWRPFCDDPIRKTVVERVAYIEGLLETNPAGGRVGFGVFRRMVGQGALRGA